jgi:multidrug efflux pump subunit AcrA (membrane-fusion protein)
MRDVKVARSEGDFAVVASGVKPGDTVVTVGQLRLAPGTKVAIADVKASE